jgi:hypothetical protein
MEDAVLEASFDSLGISHCRTLNNDDEIAESLLTHH